MTSHESISALFESAVRVHGDRPMLAVPERVASEWMFPVEMTYSEAAARVDELTDIYQNLGYGDSDLIALAFDSRPQHLLHYLALNKLGTCIVPLNTDLTAIELAYVLQHSGACAAVVLSSLLDDVRAAAGLIDGTLPVVTDPALLSPASADRPRLETRANPLRRAAAVLYTSGTTGYPKGCVLDNLYALLSGENYGASSSELTLRAGLDRVLNPLPLYHMNSLMLTFGGVISRGACMVIPGRFSLRNWWADIRETKATRFHYLGIMIPALMSLPPGDSDRDHTITVAFGAGVDPGVHRAFEGRFGIPLHEVWGMTETGRGLLVAEEPRFIETRACGRPQGIEAQVVDDRDNPVANGQVGELVIRHSASEPRYGLFSGYLHDDQATERAWAGGWFHTGDLVCRDDTDMYYFVDRAKNIIRRSGENISSAEVESVLVNDPRITQVSVLAVPDKMRDEEVLAVVVPVDPAADELVARSICQAAREQLAYFKVPGWIQFVDALPTTGTQKVQKHLLFPAGFDEIHQVQGLHDCRDLKKR